MNWTVDDYIMTCTCSPSYCALCGTWPAQMTVGGLRCVNCEEKELVLDRIQEYLQAGGLFNPEAMDHNKVRDLILDCREVISS